MKRGLYKSYFDPGSSAKLPRTTSYYNKKKAQIIQYPDESAPYNSEQDLSFEEECIQNDENIDEDVGDENSENRNEESIEHHAEESVEHHAEESIEHHAEENIILQLDDDISPNEDFWNQFDEVFDNDNEDDYTEPIADLNWFEEASNVDSESSHCSDEEKLCDCTDTTKSEAIAMVLSLTFKQSLTWESTIGILSIINSLFGKNIVPATKYKLFQLFPVLQDAIIYHIYCKACMLYIAKYSDLKCLSRLSCNSCGQIFDKSNASYFLTFNLRSQLQKMLENPEIQNALHGRSQRIEREKDVFNEIYDGYMYKKLCNEDGFLLDSPYNLSYTFSTDGCQTSKSSRMAAWPIYIKLHKLPPNLRSENILMAGLWVSDKRPNMNLFLTPFVEEANSLSTEGVQWILNNEQIVSKVVPLCGCFDSAARCKVLNMKQYNGYYGCTFCEHAGEPIEGIIKFPMSTQVPKDRTDNSIKQAMMDMVRDPSVEHIRGVKGATTLMNLEYFDLVEGMIPDYMHAVLLGVINQHTNILLSHTGSDYYIGHPDNILRINNRLLPIKHPSCITRATRKIEERDIWKASEWRSWLLFYSLLCLDGILKKKYLQHLALLVSAMHLLLSEKLSHDMIDKANTMLIRYAALYQEYFGKSSMTYNVHLLLHLHTSVLNWGPLYTHNAFCFENENRILLQFRKSPAQVTLQIAKKYFFKKSLMTFTMMNDKSTNFEVFCAETLSRKIKNILRVEDVILIGQGSDYELNDAENALVNFNRNCKVFNRMIANNFRYTSQLYRQCKQLNDYTIEMKDGKIGCITKFCYFPDKPTDKIIVFYKEILVSERPFLASRHFTINHIKQCIISDTIQACTSNFILKHGFLVKIRNHDFFISIPKGCHED